MIWTQSAPQLSNGGRLHMQMCYYFIENTVGGLRVGFDSFIAFSTGRSFVGKKTAIPFKSAGNSGYRMILKIVALQPTKFFR